MKKVLVAVGTRPEAVKLCPVIAALREREIPTVVCSTGQHGQLLADALKDYRITPDIALEIHRNDDSLSTLTAALLSSVKDAIRRTAPDCIAVQGDTATAFAAALAGFYEGIPVAHVEAGLRTYRQRSPFPEEFHRRAIAHLAAWHFAPTATAKRNLIREGIREETVYQVGNTVIDALRYSLAQPDTPEWDLPPRLIPILFTAHRRESFGEPMRELFRALLRLLELHPRLFAFCPLHPNPQVRREAEILRGHDRVRLIDPPGPIRFHKLLASCRMVLTDSGGIQEEVTSLGVPTLVMRFSTERTEGIRAGCLRLVGTHEEGIVNAANELLAADSPLYAAMSRPSDVFGDGHAAGRIAAILAGQR